MAFSFYTKEYGSRYATNTHASNEVNISSLETKLSDLTSLLVQLVCEKQVQRSGAYTNNVYLNNRYPTSQYRTEEAYSYGGFSYQYQGPSYDRYDSSYPSYNSTPSPTQSYYKDSGMSLEDIVKSLATSTLTFQQGTYASLQNLEEQLRQLKIRVEKLGAINEKRLEIFLEEDEEDDTNQYVLREDDIKEKDLYMLEPLVVPPPFATPLSDIIKEEECVYTWETFTDEYKEVFPSDGTFADLLKEISLKRKGYILEIRADFKAPRHHVKTHVWGFDLLDPG